LTITLDAMVESALGDGLLSAGETILSGQLADNRLTGELTACQSDEQACSHAEVRLDTETVSQTIFVYDDVPDTPISIGATNTCGGGNMIVRTFVVSDSFTVTDVKLGFNADLTYRNTVVPTLSSPAGKQVILHYPLGYPGRNLDVMWDNSAWDILFGEESPHDTAAPYYENVRRPDQDINHFNGENAQGVWTLSICDHFSLAAENGFYNRSRLILSTDRLPTNTRAWWRYSLPNVENQDGVTQTLVLYGLDSVGNRTDPMGLTFQVDTVAPAIVYFTHTTTLRPGEPFFLIGSVSDGSGVKAMRLSGLAPNQEYLAKVMTLDYVPTLGAGRNGATWVYTDTRLFTQPGDYQLWVEAIDDAGNESTVGPLAVTSKPSPAPIYLPLVFKGYTAPKAAPDLVVERILASRDDVALVVKNQGSVPVNDDFWVDVYIDPDPIPTAVNQTWNGLADMGLVWGVTAPLAPGEAITLTIGDPYYWKEYSVFSETLSVGTWIYAQADSANADTDYGAILELHEMVDGPYNNISSVQLTSQMLDSGRLALGARDVPYADGSQEETSSHDLDLPPRP
jgi:subtilisin-like proprotein convertase family protein